MKFPIFASFIVFLIWLTYEIRKNNQLRDKINEDFWEKESKANSIRKKNLDNLPYITVPMDLLPSEDSLTDEEALKSLSILKELSEKRILNLNGISNTDLKLEYGTANITVLSEYDENFETFSRHIYLLSQKLYDFGRKSEAKALLERTISTKTDITSHYKLLAIIYIEDGQAEKLDTLIDLSQNLRSMTKDMILKTLSEYKENA